MRKFYFVVMLCLLFTVRAEGCVHRDTLPRLTGFVMDTLQSLLPDAEVAVNGVRIRTSWDGRFVLEGQQWRRKATLVISCKGYEKQKVALRDIDASVPLIVRLTPKKQTSKERDYAHHALGAASRTGIMYKTAAIGTAAEDIVMMDYMTESSAAERPSPLVIGSEPNDVSAGRLTAGEVNDFAKWHLWSAVLDSTHKQHAAEWGITARERYTVQVVNKHGYPLVNQPVSLLDANGNTLFQAQTDNTGKAELWNGLTGKRAEGKPVIRINEQTLPAKTWETVVLDEPCDYSDGVDVLFVFDATGSMGDELRYLQAEMKDVIARAAKATGGLDIRTGAVVYRDRGDDYVTRISRLTTDISTTQAFIDAQSAGGGGDYPEAVPEALMAALNSAGWDESARARIAFLILDAPCHSDSGTVALLQEQILNAAASGVRIVPVVCSGLDESGELLMRSIALATNGTSFFLTDDSGIGGTHLKPTTDTLSVEHLNDMLVRTIVGFSYLPDCAGHWHEDEIEQLNENNVPDPFDARDLKEDDSLPHGPTTLYLLDVSGKLIYVYQGELEKAGDSQLSSLPISLSTGVYFVKAYYDGKWHVKKILVH